MNARERKNDLKTIVDTTLQILKYRFPDEIDVDNDKFNLKKIYNCIPKLSKVDAQKENANAPMFVQAYASMFELMTVDQLTGLYNRRALFYLICEYVENHDNFSMAITDIDAFFEVNNTHGHLIGDEALKYITEVILRVIRDDNIGNCIVGRYAGDEFVVILRNKTPEVLQEYVAKVNKVLAEGYTASNGEVLMLSISAGTTQYDYSLGVEENLGKADNLMMENKRTRRKGRELTR